MIFYRHFPCLEVFIKKTYIGEMLLKTYVCILVTEQEIMMDKIEANVYSIESSKSYKVFVENYKSFFLTITTCKHGKI